MLIQKYENVCRIENQHRSDGRRINYMSDENTVLVPSVNIKRWKMNEAKLENSSTQRKTDIEMAARKVKNDFDGNLKRVNMAKGWKSKKGVARVLQTRLHWLILSFSTVAICVQLVAAAAPEAIYV